MYMVGSEPFAGYLCSYQDGVTRYAIAARDIQPGEEMSKDSFEFIPAEAFTEMLEQSRAARSVPLTQPIEEIRDLLRTKVNEESEYQKLLERYPWVLGGLYSGISHHTKLDDSNIPDFTASRSHDNFRDVIEIKPPFTPLFRADGRFNANFNDYWDQAERYLDFCRVNKDYLKNAKGLRFDNPRCYLILGYQLNQSQIDAIRRKQRMNPAITVLTYNDLLTFMKSTIDFVQSLKEQAIAPDSSSS